MRRTGGEIFDDDTQTATPAPILTEDVLTVRGRPQVAANAAEALAISLDETGRVDLTRIADLLEGPVTTEQARTRLTGLVYDDPDTGELVAGLFRGDGTLQKVRNPGQVDASGFVEVDGQCFRDVRGDLWSAADGEDVLGENRCRRCGVGVVVE